MVNSIDLLIYQGATFSNTIVAIANTDLTANGYSCNASFAKEYTSVNTYQFSTTLNSNGTITLGYSANNSANTAYGDYVYSVNLTNPNGTVLRIQEGFVTIKPTVL